jgi:hypothetical protein
MFRVQKHDLLLPIASIRPPSHTTRTTQLQSAFFPLRAETCAPRMSTSLYVVDIPAFDRIAWLHDSYLHSNFGYAITNGIESG